MIQNSRNRYNPPIEYLDRSVPPHHNLAGVPPMGRAAYFRLPRVFFNLLLLSSCLFAAAACHNSCYSFTFNGTSGSGNVSVSNPPPTCSLSTANGIARLEIGAPPGAHSTPGTEEPHFTHLFVTVAGVEAHP